MKKQNWRIWLKTMQKTHLPTFLTIQFRAPLGAAKLEKLAENRAKNTLTDFPNNTFSRATWSRGKLLTHTKQPHTNHSNLQKLTLTPTPQTHQLLIP